MAGINFLSDNYCLESVVTITTGTENAQFPLSNIKNESTQYKFRSTGNTVVIEFDLVQTSPIDTVALVGDATDTFGMTAASFKTSTTTDFSLSTPIPITLDPTNNVGLEFITEVSHRYAELTLTGTGAYSELSNIFIGQRLNIPQNSISINSFKFGRSDKSDIRNNKYGQKFIDVRNSVRTISGQIENCTKDEQETLDDLFLFHGRHLPIWLVLDPDSAGFNEGRGKLTMYSYFNRTPKWSANGGQIYTATEVKLDEVV